MIWSCYWLIIRNKNWNPALAILYWIWKLCIFCVCIPFHVTNLYQKLRRKHFQKIIMIFLQIKYHMQRVDEKLELQKRGFVSRDLLAELSGSKKKNWKFEKNSKFLEIFKKKLKFKGEALSLEIWLSCLAPKTATNCWFFTSWQLSHQSIFCFNCFLFWQILSYFLCEIKKKVCFFFLFLKGMSCYNLCVEEQVVAVGLGTPRKSKDQKNSERPEKAKTRKTESKPHPRAFQYQLDEQHIRLRENEKHIWARKIHKKAERLRLSAPFKSHYCNPLTSP